MTDLQKLIKLTSKQLKEDPEVVHNIVMHEFRSIYKSMKDLNDVRDILINGLFKFKLKTRYKENKQLKYIAK